MTSLVEVLRDPARRRAVVEDGVEVVRAEVASKRGLSGAAIKAGFKAFEKIRPGVLAHALEVLLPEFAPALDPLLEEARATGDSVAWMTSHQSRVAEVLLGVTDARAQRAEHRVMLKVYRSMRPSARDHVAEAVPRLAELIERHVPR